MNAATIIVVTHNSAQWFARQRAALEAQQNRDWRLVLVDNASRAAERPRHTDLPAGAQLIQSETNLGFAEANNLAARDVDTPYLVFLNPDAFPAPDWLEQLIATAERFPQAAAIGSTQISANDERTFDGAGDVLHVSGLAYRSNHNRPRAATPPLGETFSACAAAMLVRRSAFEEIGGFDARYFCYFEDVDLCFRLRLAGGRVLQSPEAIVAHVGGGTGSASSFSDFHGARNRFWTFVKCMPAVLFWPLLPVHLLANAVAATLALGRGFSAWRGFIAGVAGVAPLWRTRREVQASRRASVGDIARALSWNPLTIIGRRPVIREIR